jgi:hypothetical protein
MSSAVVSPASFDVSNITISPPKLLPSNAKQAYLNYDGRSLTMQVGSLAVPYGLSVYDKAGPKKYSVDVSLRGYEGENPKVKAIYDSFAALDEYMIQQGVKNSKLWFKSEMSREIIKAFYTPCVRFSKDADGNPKPYPPTLKIALKQRDDKFETHVYDDKKRPMTDIPMEDILVKGAQITALIQCTGVWFAGTKFGLSWKAVQIRADKVPDSIRGFAFIDDGGDSSEAAAAPAPAPAPAPSQVKKAVAAPVKGANTFQSLADEEEDEVDDEEVFQAPAPAPVVKPVAKVSAPAPAPAPAPAEVDDDDADDMPPVELPKKVVSKSTVVKKVAVKKSS